MVPIQFILLLVIASLPAQMAELQSGGSAFTVSAWGPPWTLWISFVAMPLAVVGIVWARTRTALAALHASSGTEVSLKTDRLFGRARWTVMAITAAHLLFTPLPTMARAWHGGILVRMPVLEETLYILPAVIVWLGIWVAAYAMDEAAHERSLPFRLAEGLPVHDMPGVGAYLSLQVRHNFFPYLFLLLEGLLRGVTAWAARYSEWLGLVCTVASLALILAVLPYILVKVWSTTPLTGALRDRLEAVAARYRIRFRNIMIWRTHHVMINAMIVGWMPFQRFFLMSDSLLESTPDRELEAVFAHEVGHGVHRHIPWFLALLCGAALFADGAATLVSAVPVNWLQSDSAGLAIAGTLLLVIGGGGFYAVAPRFEHQADWFAAQHMGRRVEEMRAQGQAPELSAPRPALAEAPTAIEQMTLQEYLAGRYPHAVAPVIGVPLAEGGTAALPGAAVPAAEPPPADGAEQLAPAEAGAEVFIAALDGIVRQGHKDRHKRGLMHPSIDDRGSLLRTLARDPAARERFARSMRLTRRLVLLLLCAGVAATVASVFVHGSDAPANPATQTAPAGR